MTRWLAVIGIGDDGLDGLQPAARTLIENAELLVGGERHQAMVAASAATRLTWQEGVRSVLDKVACWRGRRVVVLTTGDPMWYGAGAQLCRRFDPDEMTILTHPGAFSLAAARMGWSLADVEAVTVHGRPLAVLNLFVAPGSRLLVLSQDGDTPAQAAALLIDRGFGPSRISVLEHLGSVRERRFDGIAETWGHPRAADFNTLALECIAGANARLMPRVPGLPDSLFETDGQLTKHEVRAVTISALAPQAGQVLWDVGAGSGSIAIEWLRSAPCHYVAGRGEASAYAVERDPGRSATITRNAATFGVPRLNVVTGVAPPVLTGLPAPDSVFVGGGISETDLLGQCWQLLKPGGRLIANAITLEAATALLAFRERYGGELVRLAVARAEPVGRLTAFRPLMEVTQLRSMKQ